MMTGKTVRPQEQTSNVTRTSKLNF